MSSLRVSPCRIGSQSKMLSFCDFERRIDDGACAPIGNNRKVVQAAKPTVYQSSMSQPPRGTDPNFGDSATTDGRVSHPLRNRDARDDILVATSTGRADWHREETHELQAHPYSFVATQDHHVSDEEQRARRHHPHTQVSWSSQGGHHTHRAVHGWEHANWAYDRAGFTSHRTHVQSDAAPSSTYNFNASYPSTRGYERYGAGLSRTEAPFEQGRAQEPSSQETFPSYRLASPLPQSFGSHPRRWHSDWYGRYGHDTRSGKALAESTSTGKGMVELHSFELEQKRSVQVHRDRSRELAVHQDEASEKQFDSREFDTPKISQPVALLASVNSDESPPTLGHPPSVPPESGKTGDNPKRRNESFPTAFDFRPVISEDSAPSEPAPAKRMKASYAELLDTNPNSLDMLCSATLELGPLQANPAGCSCPRSSCIKLYCDCFKAGRRCSGECSCTNCKNTVAESGPSGERTKAIKNILARNPRAFTGGKKEAPARNPGDVVCNCVKSRCLKLYCDCFAKGKTCTDACSCVSCLNTTEESHVGGRRKMAIQMALEKRPDAFTKKKKDIGSGCACKNNR